MDKLKIDVLANDGSPLGTHLADVYGENNRIGLGGAELALHTMCDAWHNAGHQVRLYNNPLHQGLSPYRQYSIDSFSPHDDRDILIIFRSPNHRINSAKGKKIWWSTDQYTVGSFEEFSRQVDEIVTISPRHAQYFEDIYKIQNTHVIDLAVRTQDYEQEVEKVPNRLIFCSIPDRGLDILANCYGAIKEEIPDTSLVVTSDYRLWGVASAGNEGFVQRFLGVGGVKFLGAIPRRDMVQEQMKAQIQAYPCTYDELFCYSVAECQIAGALPITSDIGALGTTNMGVLISGNMRDRLWQNAFVDMIIQNLKSPELSRIQAGVRRKALKRFSLPNIMKQWDEVFEND
jgi:glycosyltransferase involved in cell wall biosynthesis